MGSLHFSARPSQFNLGFHQPSYRAKIPTINLLNLGVNVHSSPYLRFKSSMRVHVRQRLLPVFASNTNPLKGSDESKTSDDAQGPPFLTILAGFVIFFLVIWIIGSILMWLISLIVNAPPPK